MKRAKTILLTLAMVLLPVAVALASEAAGGHGGGGGEHGAGGHPLPWKDFMFRVINFIIVVGIIYKAAGSKIKEFFSGRQYQIKAELDDMAARRKEAEAKLKEVEKSIANIEAEKKAILDEYRAQGEALKASIVADARKKAEAIEAQGKAAVSQESKAAIEQLRGEMADMVVEAAEKLLQKKLDAKAHQKLIDDYLTKVVLN